MSLTWENLSEDQKSLVSEATTSYCDYVTASQKANVFLAKLTFVAQQQNVVPASEKRKGTNKTSATDWKAIIVSQLNCSPDHGKRISAITTNDLVRKLTKGCVNSESVLKVFQTVTWKTEETDRVGLFTFEDFRLYKSTKRGANTGVVSRKKLNDMSAAKQKATFKKRYGPAKGNDVLPLLDSLRMNRKRVKSELDALDVLIAKAEKEKAKLNGTAKVSTARSAASGSRTTPPQHAEYVDAV
tara:strand:+ start:305 stop:1030 length:726 start_codon:yes stop_codon:yes gene_type:complete